MKKWLSPKFDDKFWTSRRYCLYKAAEELNELAVELLKFANKGPCIKTDKHEKIKSEYCDANNQLEKVWKLLEEYD